MQNSRSLLNLDNPVMSSYAFYASLMLLKMFCMTFLTIYRRITNKVFANPEDAKNAGVKDGKTATMECVERVRRNHLNDLENIPSFIFLGLLYVLTNPTPSTALWHFRIFAISRLLHMISYQAPLPQPSRATCFAVGLGVCMSLAVQILMAVW